MNVVKDFETTIMLACFSFNTSCADEKVTTTKCLTQKTHEFTVLHVVHDPSRTTLTKVFQCPKKVSCLTYPSAPWHKELHLFLTIIPEILLGSCVCVRVYARGTNLIYDSTILMKKRLDPALLLCPSWVLKGM